MNKQTPEIIEARKYFAKKFQEELNNKNIEIENLSLLTKIRADLLQALVAGEFDRLPGEVFGLGFVKSVCKALNLPSEEYTQLYRKCWELKSDNMSVLQPSAQKSKSKDVILKTEHKMKRNYLRLFIVIFLVCVLGYGIIWYFASKDLEKTKETVEKVEKSPVEEIKSADVGDEKVEVIKSSETPVVNPTAETSIVTNTPEIPVENIAKVETPVVPVPVEEPKAEISNEKVETADVIANSELKLTVKSLVKIKYRIDKKEYETIELQPQTYTYQIKEYADLLIYDASAIEITYANKGLGVLGGKDRIRRLRFVK
ncbi:helix-turn-helix domain-containing protein [Dolichospermum sp. ST_sed1]|nr:helix-turn-helix domain-containing protein [Dolichospermum sp. ST_sed1]